MISKKNKIVGVIISYNDEFYLSKKLLVDEPFVDLFFIVDLVDESKNISSILPSSDIIKKPIQVFKLNIDSESNMDSILSDVSIDVRDILLNSNLDLEDTIIISKCNEFVDFLNFDLEELTMSLFLVLYHKKIFWNCDITDERYVAGSIVIKFSNILQKNFFIQVFEHFSSSFDTLDHIKNKNGWVLFGFNTFQKLIQDISFGFSKLTLSDANKNSEYLKNLSENLLPIEDYDYLKTGSLKKTNISKEIQTEFCKDNETRLLSKKIKILTKNDEEIYDYDVYLRFTNNILNHLSFDKENKLFYVYEPKLNLYEECQKYYLINESKKALSVINPNDQDIIIIYTDFGLIEEKWEILKNHNISNYIKNPL